jgi:hypothetical protein
MTVHILFCVDFSIPVHITRERALDNPSIVMNQGARPTAVSSPPAVPEGWTAEWSSQYK